MSATQQKRKPPLDKGGFFASALKQDYARRRRSASAPRPTIIRMPEVGSGTDGVVPPPPNEEPVATNVLDELIEVLCPGVDS